MVIIVALFSSCMMYCKAGTPEQGRDKDGENDHVPLAETQEEKGSKDILNGTTIVEEGTPVHSPGNWAGKSEGINGT